MLKLGYINLFSIEYLWIKEEEWKRMIVTKRVHYLDPWLQRLDNWARIQCCWRDGSDWLYYWLQLLLSNGFDSDLHWLLRWLRIQSRLRFSDVLVYIHKSIYLFSFSWYFIFILLVFQKNVFKKMWLTALTPS